jgi:hypothetical protein
VARQAFELHREVEQAPMSESFLYSAASSETPLRARSSVHGIGRVVRDQLGQPVDLAVGHLQHAAGVLEHGARLQGFPKVMICATLSAP